MFVHTEMKREEEKCEEMWKKLYSGPFSSKDDKVWRKERFQVPHPVYTNRSAFVLHISSAKIRRLNVSRTRGRKRGSRDSQARVWLWPRPERKMALEWLASRDEYRVHTLRTGLLGRTRNGVLKENGKVGRVREDAFYLPGGCGSVDRSFGRSCMHALHTQLSYMLAYAGRDTVALRAIASIRDRVEPLRCFPVSIESAAMFRNYSVWSLRAVTVRSARFQLYAVDSVDRRPSTLRRLKRSSSLRKGKPLLPISVVANLAFHRWRYRYDRRELENLLTKPRSCHFPSFSVLWHRTA